MNNLWVFRGLLICLIVLEIFWTFAPWGWSYWGHDYVISAVGVGSFISGKKALAISYLSSVFFVISYVAMLLSLWWGRKFLIFSIVFSGTLLPFLGVSIGSGMQSMFSYFLVLGSGFVLGISYLPGIEKRFFESKSYRAECE